MSTAAEARPRARRLSWLHPPKPSDDGAMALVDHLKELRYRVIVAVAAILVTMVVCLVFGDQILTIVLRPFYIAIDTYRAANPEANVIISAEGLESPLLLRLKIALYAGLIISCPVWLYQIWGFIAPGLLRNEKRYALAFLGSGIPLFIAGVLLGYWISPKGFAVMLGFTPNTPDLWNIQEVQKFLNFEMMMLMVFGLSFLLPVILIALNLVGVLKGATMGRFRVVAIFLCFVFGAVATPSTDPFSMCALAAPTALMYIISEVICRANDRRRAARGDEIVLPD